MKRAVVLVTAQFLVDALKEGGPRRIEVTRNAIPSDAKIVEVKYINSRGEIAVELESESFVDLPPNQKPPVLNSPHCSVVQDLEMPVDSSPDWSAGAYET